MQAEYTLCQMLKPEVFLIMEYLHIHNIPGMRPKSKHEMHSCVIYTQFKGVYVKKKKVYGGLGIS